jgi:transposase
MVCEAQELRSISRLPIKSNKKTGVKLEKECQRNTELQWLLCGIVPNYHSISDFRKQNPAGLKNLFKLFVSFLKDVDLIGGEIITIDGTKSRGHIVKVKFVGKLTHDQK